MNHPETTIEKAPESLKLTAFAQAVFGYAASLSIDQRRAFYECLDKPTTADAAVLVGPHMLECWQIAMENIHREELIDG